MALLKPADPRPCVTRLLVSSSPSTLLQLGSAGSARCGPWSPGCLGAASSGEVFRASPLTSEKADWDRCGKTGGARGCTHTHGPRGDRLRLAG